MRVRAVSGGLWSIAMYQFVLVVFLSYLGVQLILFVRVLMSHCVRGMSNVRLLRWAEFNVWATSESYENCSCSCNKRLRQHGAHPASYLLLLFERNIQPIDVYHCVSDFEEFHWMVVSADQRFGKFLQELSSKLPPLRARSFKIEDVRKYLDHHYHYLYHCHHQQFGYGGTVEVMEEAQFPVSTNRCRSMRSLTIAESRPGA